MKVIQHDQMHSNLPDPKVQEHYLAYHPAQFWKHLRIDQDHPSPATIVLQKVKINAKT